jgi:hypothetical protein
MAVVLYDERFFRLWEYFLAISEIGFRYLDTTAFQIQIARSQDAVPLTRDYMTSLEETAGRPKRLGPTAHGRPEETPRHGVRLIHRNRPLSPLFSLARPSHFP